MHGNHLLSMKDVALAGVLLHVLLRTICCDYLDYHYQSQLLHDIVRPDRSYILSIVVF